MSLDQRDRDSIAWILDRGAPVRPVSSGEILEECGVYYSREPQTGLQGFAYRSLHIPSGKQSESVVYCRSGDEFARLLAIWQRLGEWQYASVSFVF